MVLTTLLFANKVVIQQLFTSVKTIHVGWKFLWFCELTFSGTYIALWQFFSVCIVHIYPLTLSIRTIFGKGFCVPLQTPMKGNNTTPFRTNECANMKGRRKVIYTGWFSFAFPKYNLSVPGWITDTLLSSSWFLPRNCEAVFQQENSTAWVARRKPIFLFLIGNGKEYKLSEMEIEFVEFRW